MFLSYAYEDVDRVALLREELELLVDSVWIDSRLGGGQVWWDEILIQLRQCHLFVLALSPHSLRSEACRSELQYVVDLGRPFLAVRISDTDLVTAPEEIRRTQIIDFVGDDVNSVRALARALLRAEQPRPLPEVLPDPPPMPLSYEDRFAGVYKQSLSMDEQLSLFARLKFDVDNGTNAVEAAELLRHLHDRPDLSWKIRRRHLRRSSLPATSPRAHRLRTVTGPCPPPPSACRCQPGRPSSDTVREPRRARRRPRRSPIDASTRQLQRPSVARLGCGVLAGRQHGGKRRQRRAGPGVGPGNRHRAAPTLWAPHRRGVGGGVLAGRQDRRQRRHRRTGPAVGPGNRHRAAPADRPHRLGDGRWRSRRTAPRVASAGDDKTVRLWDPANGTERCATDRPRRPGDGRGVLAGQQHASPPPATTARLRLWRPGHGHRAAPPDRPHRLGDGRGVLARTAPPLATAGNDGTVRLWDPATGTAAAPR